MAKVSVSAQAPTGVEQAWQLAVDLPRYVEWNSLHEGFTGEIPAVLEPGTSYQQQVKLMGMPAEIAWRVVEAQAPGRLELAGDGPMGVKATNRWLIEPVADGSQISVEMEFKGIALAGPMGSMVEKQAEAAMEASLAKFVTLLAVDDDGPK
jgi:hypothetical protein